MRKGILIALAVLALQADLARAQYADADLAYPSALPHPILDDIEECSSPTLWGQVDYLLWWVKDAPVPIPLVTTGTNSTLPGALGQPGTRVLFGDQGVNFGPTSGVRLTLGAALDADHRFSVEATGFLLPTVYQHYSATSGDDGSPLLAFPFFSTTPGHVGESAFQISNPNPVGTPLTGNVQIVSALELWGSELNFGACIWRSAGFQWTLLGGARYLGLRESLSISNATTDYAAAPTTQFSQSDNFDTQNQFYGGQLGTRFQWQCTRLFAELTLKCALGVTHQTVDVSGSFDESGATPLSLQHGFYTEPSNIGRQNADQFGVVPSAQLQFGYQITRCLRAVVGYDFLYWSQVVRPGNQIDRNINLSQNAAFNTGGVLVGPATPAPLFVRSDFWTQGLNVGLAWVF